MEMLYVLCSREAVNSRKFFSAKTFRVSASFAGPFCLVSGSNVSIATFNHSVHPRIQSLSQFYRNEPSMEDGRVERLVACRHQHCRSDATALPVVHMRCIKRHMSSHRSQSLRPDTLRREKNNRWNMASGSNKASERLRCTLT